MKKMLCVILSALMLAGCGAKKDTGTPAAGEPAGGAASSAPSQIVIGLEAEPATMDPAQCSDYNTVRAILEMYDQLLRFKDGSMEVEPGLAESWDVSDDGLVYVLNLRKDVKFHDGTPFNAEAVKFNIERQIDPSHEFYDTGTYPYADVTFGMVEKVEVVDEFTVKLTLNEPFTPFLANLAMHASSMTSPEAIKKYGNDITANPVGTGVYKFVSWTPGVELTLEKNPDYFGNKATVDKLVFRPIKDSNVRLNELEAGSVDLIVTILPDYLDNLKANPKLQVLEQPSLHTWYTAFNSQKEPFNDVKVRQAMVYGVNRQAIVDNIIRGTGELANNLLPPVNVGYTDDVPKYEYNPEKAKELLKEAGYENGFTVDYIIPESGSGMQQPEAMALAIQSDLAKIGVTLNIQKIEWGAYLDRVLTPFENNDVMMSQMSWLGDNGDPDNFLYVLTAGDQWMPAGFNQGFYKNEEYDKLLKEARVTQDHDKRMGLYKEAQKMLMEEVPMMVVDHEKQIIALSAKIKGFELHPSGVFRFTKVTVE